MDDYLVLYRIDKNTDFVNNGDPFTFGNEDWQGAEENSIIDKFAKGVNLMGDPKKECIPSFGKDFYVFYNKSAIKRFLKNLCGFDKEELKTITEETGYRLYEVHSEVISNGFSKMRGTIFEDEVLETIEVPFDSI